MRNACKTFVMCLSLILTVSLSGATQDLLMVDRWRLEMAARELMQKDLQDSLLVQKDSLITVLQKVNTTRLKMITSLNGILTEKDKQISLMSDLNMSHIKETVYWRDEARRHKKQRNLAIVIGGGGLLALMFK